MAIRPSNVKVKIKKKTKIKKTTPRGPKVKKKERRK